MFKVITLSVLGFIALLAVGFGLDYLGYAGKCLTADNCLTAYTCLTAENCLVAEG